MPIDLDIREHEMFGPMIEEAERKGREQGRQEGYREGLQEGGLIVLRRQIQKRFGALPKWAAEKAGGSVALRTGRTL